MDLVDPLSMNPRLGGIDATDELESTLLEFRREPARLDDLREFREMTVPLVSRRQHLDMGAPDPLPRRLGRLQPEPPHAKLLELRGQLRERQTEIDERAESHVAAHSGRAIKVKDSLLHALENSFLLEA